MKGKTGRGTAFISGGSGGIGAATALRLAARGDLVILAYNSNKARAAALAGRIEAEGGRAETVRIDLREEEAVRSALDEAAARHGGIDCVVSAHGPFIHMRHISRIEPTLFRDTLHADALAAYHLLHHALPHLRKSRGSIVALSTAATGRYASTDILSVAPKATIEALVRGIAVEEGRFGIRANCVAVGLLEDGMFDALAEAGSFTDDFIEKSLRNIPLRRMGNSAEIADAIAFLSGPEAGYITGQVLRVDGGYAA